MATFYASKTGEVSAREKEHSALVRELAGECMTLLENDGTLPLAGAGKVAVYGNGVRHTVKGVPVPETLTQERLLRSNRA